MKRDRSSRQVIHEACKFPLMPARVSVECHSRISRANDQPRALGLRLDVRFSQESIHPCSSRRRKNILICRGYFYLQSPSRTHPRKLFHVDRTIFKSSAYGTSCVALSLRSNSCVFKLKVLEIINEWPIKRGH